MSKQVKYYRLKYFLILVFSIVVTYLISLYWCFRTRWNQEYILDIGSSNPFDINKSSNRLISLPPLSKEFIKNHQNEDVFFFNRIPKTGSEMLVLLLQWLQTENNFKHFRLKNTVNRFLTPEEQLELAAEIGEKLNNSEERLVSFDRHLYFTNFTNLGLKMPIWINMVRDPIEKISSRFYYARATLRPGGFTPSNYVPKKQLPFESLEECLLAKGEECTFIDGQKYDLTIPYFCGHEDYCRELNNVAAFLKAKRNVEDWYPVVGVLEELNATLSVFESRIPTIFQGITDIYFKELHEFHLNKNRQRKEEIANWASMALRKNLSLEFEFYYFLKKRLQKQINSGF